ncbi:MAG: CbiX/SirB N-terminal domain-containing protein [Terriglobia bacterium]|jgi:sirohydrochlorin ferrochelatase
MSDESTVGILLFAHGSPVEDANRGVHELAAKIEAAGPFRYVRAAFLDGGQPDLLAGVMQAAAAGLDRLVIIPYFLTVGLHLRRDLPTLVAAAKERHPNFDIVVGQSLEGHPLMPSLVLGRAQEALQGEGASN